MTSDCLPHQIKELQGRLDLNEQSLSSARAPEPSSKGGAAVRCTPRTMPGGGTSTHSAPPHKQTGAVAGTTGVVMGGKGPALSAGPTRPVGHGGPLGTAPPPLRLGDERRGELGEEAWAPSRAPDCKSLSSTMTPTGMVAGFGSRGAVVGGTSARDVHVAPAAAGAGAGGAGGSRAASSMLVNGRGPLNSGRATGAAAEAPSRARGGAQARLPSSSVGGGGGGGGSSSANNTAPMTKGAPPAAPAPFKGAHGALGTALGTAPQGRSAVPSAVPARRALDFGAGGLSSVEIDDDVLAFTPVDVHTHDDEGEGEVGGADELDDPYDEHDGGYGGYGEGEDEDEEPYDEYDEDEDGRYGGGRYEDEDEEDEDVPEHMSSSWAREVDAEIDDADEELDDGYGYDDEEEDDEERLSPQDVEQLVERFVSTRKRCEELEGENLKLTKQLLDIAHKQAPDTLIIQVSPEMW